MILLYILLIVFILAVNFYSFLYLRSLKKAEKEQTIQSPENLETDDEEPTPKKKASTFDWKLLLSGAIGGAITIYVCMFIFKYKLNDLLLMIAMPVFAALNGYFWFVLFQSGFFIKI